MHCFIRCAPEPLELIDRPLGLTVTASDPRHHQRNHFCTTCTLPTLPVGNSFHFTCLQTHQENRTRRSQDSKTAHLYRLQKTGAIRSTGLIAIDECEELKKPHLQRRRHQTRSGQGDPARFARWIEIKTCEFVGSG